MGLVDNHQREGGQLKSVSAHRARKKSVHTRDLHRRVDPGSCVGAGQQHAMVHANVVELGRGLLDQFPTGREEER